MNFRRFVGGVDWGMWQNAGKFHFIFTNKRSYIDFSWNWKDSPTFRWKAWEENPHSIPYKCIKSFFYLIRGDFTQDWMWEIAKWLFFLLWRQLYILEKLAREKIICNYWNIFYEQKDNYEIFIPIFNIISKKALTSLKFCRISVPSIKKFNI